MDKPRVLLFNRDLTSAVPPQLLQGNSGKTYGVSRWNAQFNCHAVEMSLAEFETCSEDLRLALRMPMRQWWPRFVMPAELPEAAPSETEVSGTPPPPRRAKPAITRRVREKQTPKGD